MLCLRSKESQFPVFKIRKSEKIREDKRREFISGSSQRSRQRQSTLHGIGVSQRVHQPGSEFMLFAHYLEAQKC